MQTIIRKLSLELKREYFAERLRVWRANNREKDLAHKKKWRDTHREQKREYDKNWVDKNRDIVRDRARKRYRLNPLKHKQSKEYIKNYMKKYLKDEKNHKLYLIRQRGYCGLRKMIIAERKVCEGCQSDKNLEMHHKEYINEPQHVMLLCKTHHMELHRKD